MDFPEEQYFKLNNILLSAIGLWPYDDFKVRLLRFILSLLIIILFLSTQLIRLFVSEYSFDLFLNIFSYNIIFTMLAVKYITFYAVLKNIKEIRKHVRNNWDALKDNQEIEIMCKQGINGRLFTIILLVLIYTKIFLYIFLHYISVLLDIAMPLNESRSRELVIPAEYFIDQQKYFHIIMIHIFIAAFLLATNVIATETYILANALHAFGLFKITSYRMKNILSEVNLQRETCITKKYIMFHYKIIAAADFHRRAIEFSDLLKASFGPVYLILYIMGACSASINLFKLSQAIIKENEILEIIKSTFLVILHIVYFGIGTYAGQEFMNCDTHVYHTICNIEWYNTPLKIQKLIFCLIQKTTKCYMVDAGGMFYPNLKSFTTGMSMVISYFMVLRSI